MLGTDTQHTIAYKYFHTGAQYDCNIPHKFTMKHSHLGSLRIFSHVAAQTRKKIFASKNYSTPYRIKPGTLAMCAFATPCNIWAMPFFLCKGKANTKHDTAKKTPYFSSTTKRLVKIRDCSNMTVQVCPTTWELAFGGRTHTHTLSGLSRRQLQLCYDYHEISQ